MYAAKKMVTGPTAEPLTLAEAKAHLLCDFDDQDPLISSLITAARNSIEHETGRVLMPQTWDVFFHGFPRCDTIRLPMGTLRSLTAFEWTDSAGTVRSWTPAGTPTSSLTQSGTTKANVSTEAAPSVIRLAYSGEWPQDTLRPLHPLRIRGEWGFSIVPADIIHAMKLLIGHWFHSREEVVVGTKSSVDTKPLTRGVRALIWPYKVSF